MRITTSHPDSRYGVPVILDDAGQPMEQLAGVLAILARLGWTRQQLAEQTGVSVRTVEPWLQGRRVIPTAVLNVLSDALVDHGTKSRSLPPAPPPLLPEPDLGDRRYGGWDN